jgi:cysteine desulfurase
MKIVYADNNATTAVAPEVLEAMLPFFKDQYFNPSSMYDPAQAVAHHLKAARQTIADHLGHVDPGEILFTSCATESNNTAIRGVIEATPQRRHVVTTAVEHPAVLGVCKDLARRGCDVTFLPVDGQGNLDLGQFIRALRPDTALVTIMHANNETGVVFPVDDLARITKETDPAIVFHTDATQSMSKLPIDLVGRFRHVDLLSFSGHKLHAPKGVGALFIRRGTPCRPLMIGGHQENGRRAGTENVAFIVGMARAVALAAEHHDADTARIMALRDQLESGLLERIPHVQINGLGAPRLPGTSNFSCHYIEGEGMLFELSAAGICASSGSACTSGSLEPSHVLLALKVPFTAVHGSIRFSLSRYNTDEDVDRILDVFPQIVDRLRHASPYWDSAKGEPRPDIETMFVTKGPA